MVIVDYLLYYTAIWRLDFSILMMVAVVAFYLFLFFVVVVYTHTLFAKWIFFFSFI